MGKRANSLTTRNRTDTLPRQKAKQFYQTMSWRRLRAEYKKEKRKEHEQIVLQVYLSNRENDPTDLYEFVTDSKERPLSEPHLKDNIIKLAHVLDHKKRIRSGGAKLSKSNLQWTTTAYHNRKTGQEAHE